MDFIKTVFKIAFATFAVITTAVSMSVVYAEKAKKKQEINNN
ncbi:MAG: hypothetical protein RSB11_06265 [Oscillospiraceae bacterium]